MAQDDRNGGAAYWDRLREHRQEIMNVRAEETRREGAVQRTVAQVGRVLASPRFFLGILGLHLLWIGLNVPALSPVTPWDPYPFTFLATLASVEAPLLALLILMRQQHDARIAELREEISLQVDLHTERQSTKLLRLLHDLHRHLDVSSDDDDEELNEMKRPLDPDRLLRLVESELRQSEPTSGAEPEEDGS